MEQFAIDKSYFSLLASLFSSPSLKKIILGNFRQLNNLLIKSGILQNSPEQLSCGQWYDHLYHLLAKEYRCEYIYKNEIAKQLLLQNHTPNEAVLFTEIQVNASKADLVIVNGTTTVYEIKTELDSLERLERQIESYRKVFDKIYVVTCHQKLHLVSNLIDETIGIFLLEGDDKLIRIRSASSNLSNLEPFYIFEILTKPEYLWVINAYFGYIPDVPNTLIYERCRDLFTQLDNDNAHEYLVDVLRQRKLKDYQCNLLNYVPESLKLLTLSKKMTEHECNLLQSNLNVSLQV